MYREKREGLSCLPVVISGNKWGLSQSAQDTTVSWMASRDQAVIYAFVISTERLKFFGTDLMNL